MPEDKAMLYLASPPVPMAIEQLDLQEPDVGQLLKLAASGRWLLAEKDSHSQAADCWTCTGLDSLQLNCAVSMIKWQGQHLQVVMCHQKGVLEPQQEQLVLAG